MEKQSGKTVLVTGSTDGVAVTAGQHDVGEIDRLLSGGRDIHYPRWCALLDKRQ